MATSPGMGAAAALGKWADRTRRVEPLRAAEVERRCRSPRPTGTAHQTRRCDALVVSDLIKFADEGVDRAHVECASAESTRRTPFSRRDQHEP
jgi:hypothetical protein